MGFSHGASVNLELSIPSVPEVPKVDSIGKKEREKIIWGDKEGIEKRTNEVRKGGGKGHGKGWREMETYNDTRSPQTLHL
jgi:hypothetical protein